MAKYRVWVREIPTDEVFLEAESEEDAVDAALETATLDYAIPDDLEVSEVTS
jgi:hypothetical protein